MSVLKPPEPEKRTSVTLKESTWAAVDAVVEETAKLFQKPLKRDDVIEQFLLHECARFWADLKKKAGEKK